MRVFSILAIALSMVVGSMPALAKADGTAAAIDRYMSARTAMGGFSGAVLVARGDRIVVRKGYGFADVAQRTPYTPQTRQQVASISKMFTAMAALMLRDQGKLKLSDPICQYLTGCPAAWTPITIQELMRHTSGIPDYESALKIGSPAYLAFMTRADASARIVADARAKPLDFAPGTQFNYSNTGYVVLSQIVERAAGMSFERFVSERILRPAGMRHSAGFARARSRARLASGYTYEMLSWDRLLAGVALTDGHLVKVPPLALTNPAGDAFLTSNVDDLYRWSRVMDGGAFVSKALAKEVFTPGLDNYGYGWFVDQAQGHRRYRHTGELPGYLAEFIKFPDDDITLIILSNIDRVRLSSVQRDVTAILFGKPYDMPVRGTVMAPTAEQFARLEGRYRMKGRLFVVTKGDGLLTVRLEGGYTAELVPLSPIEFYFPLGDGRAVFTIGPEGKADRVNVRYGGEDHVAERISEH